MRLLYTLFIILALPGIFLRLLLKSLRLPAYRKRWLERLGVYKNFNPKTQGVWIHAVSVGEVVAALPLVKALRQKNDSLPITITTTTPTGSQRVQQVLGNSIYHVYLPYDIPFAIKGLIKKLQPSCLIIMETELWPNLLHTCKQHNIPTVIANGRISDRSLPRYKYFKWFILQMLQQLSFVAAQSATDAARFIELGSYAQKTLVAGNLKFEVEPNTTQQQEGLDLKVAFSDRIIWTAASTHANEEEQIIQAYREIKREIPNLLLILVPRHPDRFNIVANLLRTNAVNFVRYSLGITINTAIEVILGDTMGQLQKFYAASHLAFVGGSLVPLGGHNLLEPAMLGIPCITGPHTQNFKDITRLLLDAKVLTIVTNIKQLIRVASDSLQQPQLLEEMGNKSRSIIAKNSGAAATICQYLEQYRCLPQA